MMSGRRRREFAKEDAVFAENTVILIIKRRLGRQVYDVEVNGKMQHHHANKRENAVEAICLLTDDALKLMCNTFDLPFLTK